jgi:dipeptidyl aminopeptidase/acylaminoacyl peptidase
MTILTEPIRRTVLAAAAIFGLGSVALAGGLTPEMLIDLKQVRQVAVAPDGERVAYTLRVQRDETDDPGGPYSELWVVGEDGQERHFAGDRESIRNLDWSPDGSRISFLSDRIGVDEEERTGLFAIGSAGGEASRLFDHEGSIQRHAWSPDGKWIAFVARDAKTDDEREAEDAGRDWKVFHSAEKLSRLWLHDVGSGESRRWFDENLDVSSVIWSPDGKSVVFQAADSSGADDHYMFSKIYRVALDGTPQVVVETRGKLGPMAVSPDGEWLAWLGAVSLNDPLAQSLFVMPLDGGEARNLTDGFEGSATDLVWLGERELLLVAAESAQHALYQVEVPGGVRRPIRWPDLIVADVDKADGHRRLAFAAHSASHPAELFVADSGTRGARMISDHNPELREVKLAKQGVMTWKAPDGLEISGVLTYPLEYVRGRRYPLVLQVHGGPEGVSLNGWTSSALYPVQLLAARGFVVLQPNYRGSQGRGVAYSKADHDDLGGKEFDDILAGIDLLADGGVVDAQRVGTGGWSYGGYLSAWAATRHSERFAASIVAAGLTNWIAFSGTTDIPHEMALVHWDSWWYDEPELHWQRSPLAHLDKSRTPTLIVHGTADDRVHPEQSLELYTALRLKKVPTQLVFYPREPHGLNERAHQLDFVTRVLDWFDRHLASAVTEKDPPKNGS